MGNSTPTACSCAVNDQVVTAVGEVEYPTAVTVSSVCQDDHIETVETVTGSKELSDVIRSDPGLSVIPLDPPPADGVLPELLKDVTRHLANLESDQAWSLVKEAQAKYKAGSVLAALEALPECDVPLRWLEVWGPVVDDLMQTLTSGELPPSDEKRDDEPDASEWTKFPMTSTEDDGLQGNIYVRYLPNRHGIEMRSELLMPGKFSDHYEGLMEPDFSATACPACYDSGQQFRSDSIPGNMLVWLVIKPPLLPKLWWRDILLHRQVVNCADGVAALEYSPKCKAYAGGGVWDRGLPGMKLPKCAVSGRESQVGGYFVQPTSLSNGEPGVRWRNVQVAEIHLPKWAPVAKSWYVWAAAFILRRTLREFSRARRGGTFEKVYKQRAAERPSWYKAEWYLKG